MLEVLVRVVCAILLTVTSYYIIKKILNEKSSQKISFKTVLLLLILIIFSVILYKIQYTSLYTITIFLLNIIIFKNIFRITIQESTIVNGLLMLLLFLSDIITVILFAGIHGISEVRNNSSIFLITNIIVDLISVSLINIKKLHLQLYKFYKNATNKSKTINLVFIILLIIDFCYLAYNITKANNFNINYLINVLVMMIFLIITYIFIKEQNNYKQLSLEYDNLFNYIQTFEDWIEKDQLNRHEYKNQLAVLRCLTKEKKVKNKIDEILEDNINIEGQAVTNLKNLPKGGIKGLMYYKSAIAQKYKINLTTEVSIESKGILTKLSEKEIRILCKLIGIYFDNAIEASAESRKKNLSIEIYELKDKVNFVFSNTFKKHKNINDRNQKGVSSKGEGRGNGLYFASKLIKENKWLTQKQEIIDNYYIQGICVLKTQKKKDINP